MTDFRNIDYLQSGSAAQQKLYSVLIECNILALLSEFTPVVAGTFPLDIHIEGSDIDILCQQSDNTYFIEQVSRLYGHQSRFTINFPENATPQAVVIRFKMSGYEFELFGQDVPTHKQMGYLHMVKEYEILKKSGPDFKLKIMELKKLGLKTEPAFCKLLGISGDPYTALLEYDI